MNIHGIGIAASGGRIDGRLAQLADDLACFEALGFEVAEISVPGTSVVVNGCLHRLQVERIKETLARFRLRYTAHAPNRLNLAYSTDHGKERAIFAACLEFCAAIGAPMLVYHSGLQALDGVRAGIAPVLNAAALEAGAEREVAALKELAPMAAHLGVTIAVENGDPHLWEYALLARYSVPASALPAHHARLRIPPIVQQLEAVNQPYVGLTLDVGHLFIAANTLGFDYLDAVAEAAPWVRHLHVSDNFGTLDVGFEAESDRLPYGEADLHLPPGWGNIPLAETLACLPDYEGDLILEIKPRYWEHLGLALANTRALLAQVLSREVEDL
ncbi:MAG: sugar phosphate isomerase/epimerase [Anaerolineae bacterium]|nr:sugar phosphate isomerase/epimerase [Anaerolineae bacterium]